VNVPLGRRQLLLLEFKSSALDRSRQLALPAGCAGWVASFVVNVSAPARIASNSSHETALERAQSAAIAAIRAGFQDPEKYNTSLGAVSMTAGSTYGLVTARGVFTLQRVTAGGQGAVAVPIASKPADGLSAGAIGGVVGGAVFAFLLLCLLFVLLRRREKRDKVPPRGNHRRSSVLVGYTPGMPSAMAAEDDERFARFGVEVAGAAGGARRPRRNGAGSPFSVGTEVTDHHRYGDDFVRSPYESSNVAIVHFLPSAPEGTLQINYSDEFVHSQYEPPGPAAAASNGLDVVPPAESVLITSDGVLPSARSSLRQPRSLEL
jgi:hypothetical protein